MNGFLRIMYIFLIIVVVFWAYFSEKEISHRDIRFICLTVYCGYGSNRFEILLAHNVCIIITAA